jgi:hypothetical protein
MVVLLMVVVVVVAVVEGKAGRHPPSPHLISSYVIPARVEIACMYGQLSLGAVFFTPVQTGPGAHPASYTMGTESVSRG